MKTMAYLGYFTFFNLFALLCWYMGAYREDSRIGSIDKITPIARALNIEHITFNYEWVPIGKFRFICLRKNNPQKKLMIRKITRDREIVSFILFGVVEILTLVGSFMIGDNNSLNAIGVLIPMVLVIAFTAVQLFAVTKIENKCKAISKLKCDTVEVTDKTLSRHARNIMRERYEGENKTYSVIKEEKHTFWYDYTEYYLCVDGNKEKILVKQQKYRYSSIVETEWLTGRI